MDVIGVKSEGVLYFDADRVPRKSIVLRRMGTRKNTFAGNMVSRIYDYYFDGAINFRREYKHYYKKEFSSLTDFIEEHYNIDRTAAVTFAQKNYSMKECSIKSIERNIENLNYDKDFKQKFSDAVGGLVDEDPDGIYYK